MALAERFVSERDARARAASEIAAIGLIHELGHRAVAVERRNDPRAGGPLARGLLALDARLGSDRVDGSLAAFESAFPSLPVYRDELSVNEWLSRARGSVPGREAALEELALASIAADNPAAAAYRELIDDACLAEAAQRRLVDALAGADLAADEPDPDRAAPARTLLGRLREPILAAPQSLAAQLRWIRLHWAGWLDDADLHIIDRSLGLLDEVERAAWLRARRVPGAGAGDAFDAAGLRLLDEEPEAFSADRDWMAELVLVAKSTYVWLAQLSDAYGRDISRLDQVPDEELDELRARGFTGLWLIGLWERSPASRRIKQMRGNPDAMASAYSVADYRIADELGGDDAWRDLRDRAAARGIRLAADMVPNHMGIDSQLGRGAPGALHLVALSALRGLRLHGRGPLVGRPRGHPDRGPLLGLVRRRGRLQAHRPGDRRDALHLPRQRRHELPLERHGPARLPAGRRPRGRHRPDPRGRAALPGHPLRRRHGPGATPHPAPLVPAARPRGRHPVALRGGPAGSRAGAPHARRVLARGRRPRRRRGAGHAAAGRGLLAPGGLLRAHAGHAPRLQQRLHAHAARREERRLPAGHPRDRRLRRAHPGPLRQLHEQPRRALGHRPVR